MATTITTVDSNFEREPLIRPFGFKGGYMSEIWQTAVRIEGVSGAHAVGNCSQSVLWSDAAVFSAYSETGGNALMYALTERALQLVRGIPFETPLDLLDAVFDDVHETGKAMTGNPNLRKTFALNALVAPDNAAWLLHARERGIDTFDDMIPVPYRPALSHRNRMLASIPLISYAVTIEEIRAAALAGSFFMKIKIGQPGTQQEMLEKDKARIAAIHRAVGHLETPHTADGKIPYYFDANGRYEKKETLLRLLEYTREIGAFERIAILEEPFSEEYEADVGDLGVRIAADECSHTDEDALKRIQMGYGAISLKAIAKTLSMTLKIARVAHENSIPCFCADLTANPVLVDWNKNVAARLAPFPGLGMGVLETNGNQNYLNWETMVSYHPCAGASWMKTRDGLFHLDDDFYAKSGGIFLPSKHYEELFAHGNQKK